ncbi:hypothetical protein I204_05345 [Kwoniella mangroviensis CBS 8886]|nr:hypothetical protein I204_05345 [Kwoniella mangroviensis CBS 8886]
MAPEPSATVFARAYTDKDADINLISRDKVHFKVHFYLLKTHSSVFRDMLSETTFKLTPIPIDVHSSDLLLFLDFMHESDPEMSNNWPQCKRLTDLCLLYDCNVEIFCMASQFDDVSLAKKALKSMKSDEEHRALTVETFPLKEACKPSLAHLLGLIVQLKQQQGTRQYSTYDDYVYVANWEHIGKAFKPAT